MSELVDAYMKLKKLYPKVLEVAFAKAQGGIYLSFEGLKKDEHKKDIALFSLKIASRSLVADRSSILPLLDELRVKVLEEQNRVFGVEIFKNIDFVGFEDSLYIYSMNFEIPIFRDFTDEFLGVES